MYFVRCLAVYLNKQKRNTMNNLKTYKVVVTDTDGTSLVILISATSPDQAEQLCKDAHEYCLGESFNGLMTSMV